MHASSRTPIGRFVAIVSTFVALIASGSAFAGGGPLTGTQNIPGSFATLDAAITQLNTVGVGAGGVTLNVVAGNPQTAPLGGYAIQTTTASVANPVTVACNGNTITAPTPQASGVLTDAIFKIIGTDSVTINGCTMLEDAANTTTAAATNNMTEFGVALFYVAAGDNAQNATIVGNTIDLDRTYQNTFGVYANATHSATAITVPASGTGPLGGNSGLRVHSNNITDVNLGVVIVGPTAAADFQDNVEVGGTAPTANTITNFGTTSTFSGYLNVSTTVNGVLVRNTRNLTISNNSITSSNGGTTVGNLIGIQIPAASIAPTGTFTQRVNNNQISLRSANATGLINGIVVAATTSTVTSTTNVNDNNFANSGHTIAASGVITFISMAAAPLVATIDNNRFSNLSVNTTGNVLFMTRATNMVAGASESVSGNQIVGTFAKTGAGGTVTLFGANASSVNGSSMVNSNNNFSNITLTGATIFAGWSNTEGASTTNGPTKTLSGNTFASITGGTSAMTVVSTNFGAATTVSGNTISNISGGGAITGWTHGASNGQGTHAFSNNAFSNLTSTGTGGNVVALTGGSTSIPTLNHTGNTISGLSSSGASSIVQGIVVSLGTTVNVSGNTVNTLSGSGATSPVANGIVVAGGATVNVSQNKVYDIAQTAAISTTSPAVNGVLASGGTNVNVFNNLIGDLRAPAASLADAIRGLSVTSAAATTTYNVSYNSVLLSATSSGLNFGSTALFHAASATATTAALNSRNNVLVNNSTPAGTGASVAFRRSGVALNNYGAASNNNDFFAGAPGPLNLIFSDGTNSDQTLAAFKARVGSRDSLSVSENPPFLSTTGSSAQFLHINTAVATQLESGGVPIAGITTDFDGDTRNASTPDIGGDEFTGVLLDLNPPAIIYAPLGNTATTTNRVQAVTINDPSGVAGGPVAPRVYFRKGAAPYVSTQCAGSAPAYNCTIDNALIGGVVVGDTVQFFVVAQDNPGNVGANPSAGFTAADVNNVTSPPTTPFAYNVVAGISGTLTVGTGGGFASLTNVGGIFESLNAGVITGNITIDILSDLTGEAGTVALNQLVEEGAGAGTYTVTIRPSGAPRAITGTGTNALLIKLNGADRVTIDGSLSGGTDRSLTVTNGFANTGASVIWMASTAVGNGATGNTIRNVIVNGATGATTLGAIISSGSVLGAVAEAPNSNNGFFNNEVAAAQFAIALVGPIALESGNVIAGNAIGSTVAAAKPIQVGIAVFQQSGALVSGNTVAGIVTAGTGTTSGIRVSGGASGITITGNRISDIKNTNTGGFGTNGVQLSSSNPAANVTVSNNFIWDVAGFGFAGTAVGDNGYGVIMTSGGAYNIWSNSVLMGTNQTAVGSLTAALNIAAAVVAPVNVRNNIFANTQTIGTRFAVINNAAPAVFAPINHNDYFAQNVGRQGGVDQATLANWQAAVGQDANSVAADPLFVSGIDLHLQPASPATNAGTGIPAVTVDIDGETRSTLNPEIGADEFNAAPTITAAVGVTRREGDAGSSSTIANVSDADDPESALVVTVNGGASATVNNVTVNGIAVDGAGVVTANVVAGCSATNAGFTLRVTDTNGAFATDAFNVVVDPNLPPVLSYPALTNAVFGESLIVNPATGPSDTGIVTTVAVQNPGTYTGGAAADLGGNVSLTGAAPVGSHTLVIRATDNCGVFTDANLALTVGQANTTTTITSDNPDPSVTGQSVTVVYAVAPVAPSAGTPTGNVTVTDGVDSCIGTVAAGQCVISLSTTGARTLTATYAGDAGFTGSASAGEPHTVNLADTTTTILTDNPDPSTTGQAVTVTFSVVANAPGSGTPTGSVSVTDGVNNCAGTVATGQCVITLNTTGVRTLVATYAGDASFNGSVSAGAQHSVDVPNAAPTIVAAPITRRQGDSGTATIASVNDAEDAENLLAVTVNGLTSATVNGVTVSGISTSAAGAVSATVAASCSATNASFTLRVTDSGTLFNEATLNVTVDPNLPPVLTYPASTSAVFGQTLNVNPATGPTDSGTIATIAVQTTGTYTGGASVNAAGVVALTSAAPVGSHTLVIRATDNCGAQTNANLGLNVALASTTTLITSDTPDPSVAGQNVVVTYTVAVVAPGGGTPTGAVTVSDGVNSCSASVAAGQCTVALGTPGNRTLTATYFGSASHASSNDTEPHVVTSGTDLRIQKSSNTSQATLGLIQYTVVATNIGTVGVTGATVTDNVPAGITSWTWTCTGSNGGTCTASGSGNIAETVNLPVNASVTFAITATIPTNPLPGTITNTATVASSVAVPDTNPANNSASVTDVLLLFRDGFEDPGFIIVELAPAARGATSTLGLVTADILAAAQGEAANDVALFRVGQEFILVSARRINGAVQLSVLQRDLLGIWHAGPWMDFVDGQSATLIWSNIETSDPAGTLRSGLRID